MTASDDPTTPSVLSAPGRVLGERYELERPLGSGGMAVVWVARDRVLDRDVAVKILREQYATDPVFLARFTAEALHAARLSHPGLVTIFDAGVDQGTAFLVMEVVHGRTLHEVLLREGSLEVGRAVMIAADVCDVLEVAHRAGVVHRDIKPGNILISDDGSTRVFDFGIARTEGSPALTQTATVIGTAAYLSPEQAAGGPATQQSDLYSVGCVLLEMLTASPPFTAETPVALLYQHIHDTPPVPSSTRPEIDNDLDAVVLHLLAKDPADRPATAADAHQELLAVMPGSPVADTRVLPTLNQPPDEERTGRTRVLAATVAAVAFLLAVAAGAALLGDRQDGGTPTAAASPSTSRPSSTPPSPTPSAASPSGTAAPALVVRPATTPVGAITAFLTVVQAARRTALVNDQDAEQLLTSADAVAKALDKGKGKSAVPRSQSLVDLVSSLVDNGQVAPAAVEPLEQAATQLLRLVTESS